MDGIIQEWQTTCRTRSALRCGHIGNTLSHEIHKKFAKASNGLRSSPSEFAWWSHVPTHRLPLVKKGSPSAIAFSHIRRHFNLRALT